MSVASVHHVSYYSNLGMISEKACLRFDSDLIIHKMVLAMVVLLRAKKKSRVGPVVVEMMMYKCESSFNYDNCTGKDTKCRKDVLRVQQWRHHQQHHQFELR